MIDEEDEILVIFYEESREHLETFEDDLLALEGQGADFDDDLMNSIFRAVHTIKGGCSFFGLTELNSLSHVMESLLDRVRKREMELSSQIINVLLKGADLLKIMVEEPERTSELDIEPVVEEITAILEGAYSDEEAESATDEVNIKLPSGRVIFTVNKMDFQRARSEAKGGSNIYILEYDLIKDIERKNKTPWEVISELAQLANFIDSKIDFDGVNPKDDDSLPTHIPFYILISTVIETDLIYDFLDLQKSQIHLISETGEFLDPHSIELEEKYKSEGSESSDNKDNEISPNESIDVSATVVEKEQLVEEPEINKETSTCAAEVHQEKKVDKVKPKPVPKPRPKLNKGKGADGSKKPEGSIRVHLGLLDKLMSLAGELVLARNELIQNTSNKNWEAVSNTTQRVDLITIELQEAIMATRMQSIGIVFNKFNRVVRDLSSELNKDIKLILEGESVELDKTIIESIGDPLTHIVRNSLDHGIETPDERRAAGKGPQGTLKIGARHEGGHVVIEIIDDGRGINVPRVKEKALENGLCTEAELARMSDKDAVMLIFKPGFSTAEKVTSVSGRGVGMDVVLTNLNKLGGSVDVDSDPGHGTRLTIKLPLTLAIIPSLLVRVDSERYAIPQVNLIELVRISVDECKNRVERVGNAIMMRLRDRLLPMINLRDIIMSSENLDSSDDIMCFDNGKPLNIAVLTAGDMQYGLIVDELLDSSEIVVKPLGRHLKKCIEYAGATILGDGSVALILDVPGLAIKMNMNSINNDNSQLVQGKEEDEPKSTEDRQTLLLVNNAKDEPFAIPLGLVARIEKINTSDIESVGGRRAIKYRGETLILFSIEEVATVTPREETDTVYVVVFRIAHREVGLLLSEIKDIITNESKVDSETYAQTGIFGSAIIDNRITLIVDIHGLVYTIMPNWRDEHSDSIKAEEIKNKTATVLIAEDSKFFMSQLKGFMEEIGFKVLTAEDGAVALDVLNENADDIDLVLTDIEMPVMDGIEFTTRVRQDPRFDQLPMLAVTSVAGDAAEKIGLEAGLDEYLVKLDRDELLERSSYYLKHGRETN